MYTITLSTPAERRRDTINEREHVADENYTPVVSVRTKKINDKPDGHRVKIRVEDNGNGIPQNIVAKIFQPFLPRSQRVRKRAWA